MTANNRIIKGRKNNANLTISTSFHYLKAFVEREILPLRAKAFTKTVMCNRPSLDVAQTKNNIKVLLLFLPRAPEGVLTDRGALIGQWHAR